jgi:hypothetical protein
MLKMNLCLQPWQFMPAARRCLRLRCSPHHCRRSEDSPTTPVLFPASEPRGSLWQCPNPPNTAPAANPISNPIPFSAPLPTAVLRRTSVLRRRPRCWLRLPNWQLPPVPTLMPSASPPPPSHASNATITGAAAVRRQRPAYPGLSTIRPGQINPATCPRSLRPKP